MTGLFLKHDCSISSQQPQGQMETHDDIRSLAFYYNQLLSWKLQIRGAH